VANWNANELAFTNKQSWEEVESSASAIILDPQAIQQPKNSDLKSFTLVAESRKKQGGAIIIVPSSRFILDKYLSQTSDNLKFILNVVNDYASGGALSGIRQRAVSFYPLPNIPDSQKDIFKYVNILLLPSLFAIIGGWRLVRRR